MATRSQNHQPSEPVSEWDALIEQADFSAAADVKHRVVVDVPDVVLNLVTKARTNGTPRFTLPVKSEDDYNSKSSVLYSAGLKVTPPATITVVPGIVAEGRFTKVDDVTKATHLRATVGARRGGKTKTSE